MDYRQTLDFLFNQLPMFQRVGAAAYKTDLNNTIRICNILGNPQDRFPVIHIAGTNGKGSVAHMLSSILQEAGLRTGLYTSPHLKDFRERIKINGRMIPRLDVIDFVEEHIPLFREIQPSFFEYTFGMAMKYFADESVDIAVVETGMGGRLDSTNIIHPVLSVITNIGLDHTRFLGKTLELIAKEKAGIIKLGVPVIIGETQESIKKVFLDKAREKSALICFADQEYSVYDIQSPEIGLTGIQCSFKKGDAEVLNNLFIPFTAAYQLKNACTVVSVCDHLNTIDVDLPEKEIRKGLEKVIPNTGFRGRWQIINESPLTICDTGHNLDGIKQVIEQISRLSFEKLHFVFGTVDDKDLANILKLLPASGIYYFCKADIPRALDQNKLKEEAWEAGLKGESYASVKEAYSNAKERAGQKDLVFVGGSTFVVAEVV